MGKILSGILGGFSGKVGPVVGANWKTIDYMRSYSIPENPNTANQQTVRAKFSALVALARQILSNVIQPYWDQFYTNMSGFNAWIKENYSLSSSAGVIDETALMSKGTLVGTTVTEAEYTSGSGQVVVTFDTTLTGNAQNTDSILCTVLLKASQVLSVFLPIATRGDGTFNVALDTGLTPTDIVVFVTFYRGTGAEMIVSDSDSVVGSAP